MREPESPGGTISEDPSDTKIESLFKEREITCYDVALNCSKLIPVYQTTGAKDSARILLDYWGEHCGEFEDTYRTRLLFAIEDGEPIGSLIGRRTFQYLGEFETKYTAPEGRYFWSWFRPSPIAPALMSITTKLADNLRDRPGLSDTERLMCRAYSGDLDGFYGELCSDSWRHKPLRQYYDEVVKDVRNASQLYGSVWTEDWIPTGNRSQLGNHPSVGFAIGVKHARLATQLAMSFAFLNAPSRYIVENGGIVDTTRRFQLLYLGLEFGRELWRGDRDEVQLLFGGGIQGLILDRNEAEDKSRDVSSGVIMLGGGYRRYLGMYSSNYIAIEPRFELSRINTNGGTNLSGGAFRVRVTLGFGSSDLGDSNRELRRLRYHY